MRTPHSKQTKCKSSSLRGGTRARAARGGGGDREMGRREERWRRKGGLNIRRVRDRGKENGEPEIVRTELEEKEDVEEGEEQGEEERGTKEEWEGFCWEGSKWWAGAGGGALLHPEQEKKQKKQMVHGKFGEEKE